MSRRGWYIAYIALCLLFLLPAVVACAGHLPTPSEKLPVRMCRVICPGGFVSNRQLLCRGRRQFESIRVTGERVERNEDGSIKSDVWISTEGDYPKSEVARMDCQALIRQIDQSRSAEQRGRHPGEPEPWTLPEP